MTYEEASKIWYGLDDAGKANLIEVIGYTITCRDDNAIHVASRAHEILDDFGIDKWQLSEALDSIAVKLRGEHGIRTRG